MSGLMQLQRTSALCAPGLMRGFHSSDPCQKLHKLTRLRVVDNSELGKQAMMEGKPPKIIHIYNKKGIGTVGM